MSPKKLLHDARGTMSLAILLVGLAAVLRVWPLQGLEPDHYWLTFYPAVTVSAIYRGFHAGLLAPILACVVVTLLWPFLVGQPSIENTEVGRQP